MNFAYLFRLLALLLFAGSGLAGVVSAQEIEPEIEESEDIEVFSAPVIVDGDVLFNVRGSSALPADERASNVATRIIDVAERSDGATVAIVVEAVPLGLQVLADGVAITLVTDADSDMEQMETDVLASVIGEAIKKSILNYRQGRTGEAIASGAIEAGAWTLVFALFTTAIFWLRRWLRSFVSAQVGRHFAGLDTATNEQVQADAIAALIHFGINVVLFTVFFLGAYYYLSLVLLAFAETRYFAQLLLTYVTEPILNIVIGFIRYLPNLVTLIIIALMTRFVIRGVRIFFEAVEAGTFQLGDFEKHWINPTYNIVRAALILIAIVFAFPYIPGSDSAAFQGLTILVGAMLSLGSNSVVANMLAGIFVIYRRSTSIGDRIKVGNHVGDVVQIKMMETHLKSIKNELISIPNALLMNSDVVNYSKQIEGQSLLLHSTVGIGYEEPTDKIEAMLIEAALRTTNLKKRPKPFVMWEHLADYAINYQINAYVTKDARFPQIRSDLNRNIVAVFNENKVQIMTPSYIADPEVAKIPEEDWDGALIKKTRG